MTTYKYPEPTFSEKLRILKVDRFGKSYLFGGHTYYDHRKARKKIRSLIEKYDIDYYQIIQMYQPFDPAIGDPMPKLFPLKMWLKRTFRTTEMKNWKPRRKSKLRRLLRC